MEPCQEGVDKNREDNSVPEKLLKREPSGQDFCDVGTLVHPPLFEAVHASVSNGADAGSLQANKSPQVSNDAQNESCPELNTDCHGVRLSAADIFGLEPEAKRSRWMSFGTEEVEDIDKAISEETVVSPKKVSARNRPRKRPSVKNRNRLPSPVEQVAEDNAPKVAVGKGPKAAEGTGSGPNVAEGTEPQVAEGSAPKAAEGNRRKVAKGTGPKVAEDSGPKVAKSNGVSAADTDEPCLGSNSFAENKGSKPAEEPTEPGTRFTCDEIGCDSSFKLETSLVRHKRACHLEKKHSCDECGATFATPKSLIYHRRLHSGEVYKCDECDSTFVLPSRLRVHKRIHDKSNYHKCDVCGVSFAEYKQLIRHGRKHSGEKPYKCTLCDAKFARPDNLKSHQVKHVAPKKLVCDTCGQEFSQKYAYTLHVKSHGAEKVEIDPSGGLRLVQTPREKKFECMICGKKYEMGAYLRKHLENKHGADQGSGELSCGDVHKGAGVTEEVDKKTPADAQSGLCATLVLKT